MALLAAALAVALLIVLIARLKLNAFIALVIASLVAGAGAGLPLPRLARAFQDGVGATLGFIAHRDRARHDHRQAPGGIRRREPWSPTGW